MKIKFYFLTAIFSAILATYFMKGMPFQFFCLILFTSLLFIILSSITKKAFVQYLCITLFSIGFALSAYELYCLIKPSSNVPAVKWVESSGSHNAGGYYTPNDTLGYAPASNSESISVLEQKYRDNSPPKVVYDVVYTINELGHRITPHQPDANIAVLFLGGSFTFGEGLNDHENFSYLVGEALGQNFQVYNFGFSGYGPHQALAALEGDVNYLNKYKRIYVFYSPTSDHPRRSSGMQFWDRVGPRYLIEDGKLVQRGSFMDYYPQNIEQTNLEKFLNLSHAYKANIFTLKQLLLPYSSEKKQMELFKAIVAKAAETLKQINSNSLFTVLAWGGHEPEPLIEGVPDGIPVVNVSGLFPDYATRRADYAIPIDGHPNALANKIVADEVVKIIQNYEKNN